MRLLFFIPLFGVLAAGQGQQDPIEFINPPPGGPVGDYSLNPTFVLGSNVNIQWRWTSAATSTSEALSLVVWQELRGAEFEHIFQNETDVLSHRWTVGTQKDLSVSNVFFFQMFIEGETGPAAGSHYFNISNPGSDENPSSSTSTPSPSSTSSVQPTSLSSVATSTSSTTTASTASTASTAPAATTPSTVGLTTGGLTTGAKVGLGVGIPAAVILGLIAGWLFFGRRKKKNDLAAQIPPAQNGQYQSNMSYAYQPPPTWSAPVSELDEGRAAAELPHHFSPK